MRNLCLHLVRHVTRGLMPQHLGSQAADNRSNVNAQYLQLLQQFVFFRPSEIHPPFLGSAVCDICNLNSGLLARIVDAEFFVTHFAILPTVAFLFRAAILCGSNGLWQTSILQTPDSTQRCGLRTLRSRLGCSWKGIASAFGPSLAQENWLQSVWAPF